ncbi:MAG TPA: 16S rRNA (guanine(527)-N(7))-methyltransferase RsmG [Treponema sp.]|nr:16S rRNA (guanine(527)-N(7))-methyltransferase RsmG [Treponema sp.]
MNEKLTAGLEKLGLAADEEQLRAFDSYVESVLDCNRTYNLMKADSADELVVSHLLDSLAAVSHISAIMEKIRSTFSDGGPLQVGDIGSGGGCPGLPLAVMFPDVSFTLVERMEKRCVFLESAVAKMGLKNVKVFCTQASSVPKESFHIQVFRAFHPFDPKIAALLLGMAKKGGYIVAYKARSEKIQAEMEEVSKQIPSWKKIPLTVPFLEDHERNLVVIRK